MTTTHFIPAQAVRPGPLDWLAGTVDVLRTRIGQWRLYRRTFDELDALSARELTDLGLRRSDIHRVARAAAYGD